MRTVLPFNDKNADMKRRLADPLPGPSSAPASSALASWQPPLTCSQPKCRTWGVCWGPWIQTQAFMMVCTLNGFCCIVDKRTSLGHNANDIFYHRRASGDLVAGNHFFSCHVTRRVRLREVCVKPKRVISQEEI